jgi:hypothetical protein
MSGACGDLNQNCRSKAEKASKEPCPPFEQKKSCWELDWKPFIRPLSEEEKMIIWEWRRDNCPECPAYKNHQVEIDLSLS